MSDQVLRNHLEAEVMRLHKERRNGLLAGAITILIVLGYMSWINSKWSYVTKPSNVAQFSAGIVLDSLPALRTGTEKMLTQQAPQLAKYVGDTVTEQVPKLVSQMVGSLVTRYTASLSRFAVDKYTEAFKSIVANTKRDIAKAVASDSNDVQELAVVAAIEKQVTALGTRVQAGELTTDPLFKQIKEGHVALAQLNERLRKVIAQDDKKANRKDKLTKRFLGTFWRFVQQENPDIVIENTASGAANAAPAQK